MGEALFLCGFVEEGMWVGEPGPTELKVVVDGSMESGDGEKENEDK